MTEDEWRVEIDLDDEEHGYGLGERLRARDLDDEARKRLGGRVMVTRDGPRVFLYAGSEHETREAERVARGLVSEEGLTAEVPRHEVASRGGGVEGRVDPASRTEAEEEEELDRKEAADWQEAVEEGSFDWIVKVELPSGAESAELADRLSQEGYQVHRRWRYLTIDVVTRSGRTSWRAASVTCCRRDQRSGSTRTRTTFRRRCSSCSSRGSSPSLTPGPSNGAERSCSRRRRRRRRRVAGQRTSNRQ